MALNNPHVTELIVPRDPEAARRIHGFFETIGWDIRNASNSEFDTLASPDVGAYPSPTIAYWQSEGPETRSLFEYRAEATPSNFSRGRHLSDTFARVLDLSERSLIVPSDEMVHKVFEQGSKLLKKHTYIGPRAHAGRQEFRFRDPFGFSLRVTADPGYEVNPSDNPLVGQRMDHIGGTSYTIDEVVLRAQSHERTGTLSPEAIYTQDVAGGYPAGTRYSRSVE